MDNVIQEQNFGMVQKEYEINDLKLSLVKTSNPEQEETITISFPKKMKTTTGEELHHDKIHITRNQLIDLSQLIEKAIFNKLETPKID